MNKDITDFQLGWVIGLFEGEASFTLRPRQAAVQMAQVSSDIENLNKVKEYLQIGTVVGPYGPYKENKQSICVWSTSNYRDVYQLCTLIQPFMSERRQKQIQKVLDFIILKDRKKSYDV